MLEMFILWLLFIKHWYVDYVNQTMDEIQSKGNYGEWTGIEHSLKHGALTALILALFINPIGAFVLGVLDALIHYHIDWTKSNYGARDYPSKKFWVDFGLDQLAHYTTYLILVSIIM